MDEWLKERIKKLDEKGVNFQAIVDLTGKDEKEIEGVLGEKHAEDYNQRQKDEGIVGKL